MVTISPDLTACGFRLPCCARTHTHTHTHLVAPIVEHGPFRDRRGRLWRGIWALLMRGLISGSQALPPNRGTLPVYARRIVGRHTHIAPKHCFNLCGSATGLLGISLLCVVCVCVCFHGLASFAAGSVSVGYFVKLRPMALYADVQRASRDTMHEYRQLGLLASHRMHQQSWRSRTGYAQLRAA